MGFPWVDVADNGTIYALGYAGFPEYPWTFPMYQGAYCTTFIGGDAYLALYTPNMTRLLYATIIGGNRNEFTTSTYLDKERGIVYIGGRTSADWVPNTSGCISNENEGAGEDDLFLLGFSVKDFDLTYGTFLGGSGGEWFPSNNLIEVDSDGTILFTGTTNSDDFPTTSGTIAHTKTQRQVFLMRIDPNPCSVPTPPIGLFAIAGEGHIKLFWQPTSYDNCEMRHYNVYRSTTPDPEDKALIGTVDWRQALAYDDTSVLNGTKYYYWVTAVNYVGESDLSNRVSAVPIGTPMPPKWLNATTGDRTVHLNWSEPSFDGGSRILGYRVLRGLNPTNLNEIRSLGNVTSYVDTEAVAGTGYHYAVLAFNIKGDGPWSNVVNITPAGPPSEPLFLSANELNGSVMLTWEPPEYLGGEALQGYRILRGSSPGDLSLLAEVGPDASSHLDEGLANGQTYYYCILAYSDYGASDLTYVLSASPFGEPGVPRELKRDIGDRNVVLTWLPPLDDGGRPVIGYVVYFGTDSSNLVSMTMVNQTNRIVPSLENSVFYLFAVATVTTGTEGPMCEFVVGKPEGPPSVVSVFSARSVNGTVDLTWERPDYTGDEILTYRISRGTTSDDLQPLQEVTGVLGTIDEDVEIGQTYFYRITAFNSQGPSPPSTTREVTVEDPTVLERPGVVETFEAVPGDGFVVLSWAPPSDTGGSEITGYVLYRGIFVEGVVQLVEVGPLTDFVDSQVDNNMEYLYQVAARNAGGTGPRSAVVNVTPMPVPGKPHGFTVRVRDGKVLLDWEPPLLTGTAPVTGYAVWRGASANDMVFIAEVGEALSYVDRDVKTGGVYYYQVVPQSHVGDGEGTDVITPKWPEGGEADLRPILLVLLVMIAVLAGALYLRGRKVRPKEVGETVLAAKDEGITASFLIEQVFLVHKDGRLMAECSREDCSITDLDLMSSMLIAVHGLMQDGLRRGSLKSIRYGDSLVLLSAGQQVNLAVVVYGEPGEDLREEMESTISRIEASYAGVIEEWTGDSTALTGLDGMVRKVLDITADVSREDVSGAGAAGEVSVLSAVDLHRGDTRLKVAVVNDTEETITDVSFQVSFDKAVLTLHRVEPLTLTLDGRTVNLGNVRPGERKTAAILFAGSPADETDLEGTLTFTDSVADLQRVEMKRRKVGKGG
jgi:fibronectin type 3 domain-containing protein